MEQSELHKPVERQPVYFPQRVTILGGPPVHGKTLPARTLKIEFEKLGIDIAVHDVDQTRRELQNGKVHAPISPADEKNKMKPAYTMNNLRIKESLLRGLSVIAVATYSRLEYRREIERIAMECHVPIQWLYLDASRESIEKRLEERNREADPDSNIQTMADYDRVNDRFEPFDEVLSTTINTDIGKKPTVEAIKHAMLDFTPYDPASAVSTHPSEAIAETS